MARIGVAMTVWFLAAQCMMAQSVLADADVASEKEMIEALIEHVAGLKEAVFLRNGREHDSRDAAKFIRIKWRQNERDIKTAADFVEKAASFSSTTRKEYMIRFADGRQIKTRDYLLTELKKLTAAAAESEPVAAVIGPPTRAGKPPADEQLIKRLKLAEDFEKKLVAEELGKFAAAANEGTLASVHLFKPGRVLAAPEVIELTSQGKAYFRLTRITAPVERPYAVVLINRIVDARPVVLERFLIWDAGGKWNLQEPKKAGENSKSPLQSEEIAAE
ncbi:MAG TPA: DUF5329 family protein [Planctomycetaceae bacterium]|nr:DUF5329 family protein [Planctomycetaceae bacterium]